MGHILQGIRMIDWGAFHAGVASGYMLGDLGAEIIKIEEPVKGDPMRGTSALYGGEMYVKGRHVGWELTNRNKKSVTLDLKKEKGREILYGLVEKSDVFYTNYRPSLAVKLGVDYASLRRYNPSLIYAKSPAYGTRGPEAEKRGFDPVAMARSGAMWAMGDRDDPEPVQTIGGIFDQAAAIIMAYGILAALLHRERTGEGQEIESSLLGAGCQLYAMSLNHTSLRGRAYARHSRIRGRNPMSNHYRCADDKWLVICEPQSDRFWHEFCDALRLQYLENDPRFNSARGGRREHYAELIQILDEVFATKTRAEWSSIFEQQSVGFAWSPVHSFDEVINDRQVLENNIMVPFEHPVLGHCKVPGNPVWFYATPPEIQREAPELGQHTEEVLTEICGLSWEEIAQLKDERVI